MSAPLQPLAAPATGGAAAGGVAAGAVAGAPAAGPGVLLTVASMASVQLGAALSPPLLDRVGTAGITWLRLSLAALALLAFARPRLRGRSRRDLVAAVALGAASGAMTLSFFEAVHRIPLGVAVTIDFLGPLGVALLGARRLGDLAWVALAAGGVLALTAGDGAGAPLDPAGVAFAGVSALGWAMYIVLTQRVGRAWAGLDGLAVSLAVAALVTAPAAVGSGALGRLDAGVLAACVGLALLVPLLPYSLELLALRRLPARVFGVLMSLEPAIGALLGFLLLAQGLTALGVAAIGMVVVASAGAALCARG